MGELRNQARANDWRRKMMDCHYVGMCHQPLQLCQIWTTVNQSLWFVSSRRIIYILAQLYFRSSGRVNVSDYVWIDLNLYGCFFRFAKNNFPSCKTLVALFTNFFWRPFCFRSNISVPPTTIFLDFLGLLWCIPTQKYQFSFCCSFFYVFRTLLA